MDSARKYLLLLGLLVFAVLPSCKKWDSHIEVKEQALNENLMEEINKHAELSRFSEYLSKTGLDKVIASSKNFTVWAPDNDALKNLPADIVNDAARLKALLLNHISGQLFFTRMARDSIRVPMLNGKRVSFFNNMFDDANIKQADIYVSNGVLHIIDKAIAPLPSIWEYMLATRDTYAQNNYITALNYTAQDPSLAELDSINPLTGEPVYKSGTGIIEINAYLTKVYDLSDEDSLYTYFLLTNDAYDAERYEEKPFFKSADPSITDSNSCWNVVKDLSVRGMYLPGQLPQVLMSKFNVHVPVDGTGILESHKVSNGIVYIIKSIDFDMREKIPVCIVQGETPAAFSSVEDDFMKKVFYRQRMNLQINQEFGDIYLNLGSSGGNDYVDFATNNLYTTKYKVYWVSLNDHVSSGQGDDAYGTDSSLHQILQIGPYMDSVFTPVFSEEKTSEPYDYTEVYIGEYTNDSYDWLLSFPLTTPDGKSYTYTPATQRLRLQSPAKVPSGVPHNITIDYIKLVPEF